MQVILTVAVPIFALVLVGYLAGRFRILGREATTVLTAFASYFALPVLFFGTLARTPVAQVLSLDLLVAYGLIMIATFGIGMFTTWLVTRGAQARGARAPGADRRGGLAAMSLQGIAASWGNVGYMGVPLCLAAFGAEGLPPAMLAVIVSSVVSMIFGVLLIEIDVATNPGPFVAFLQAAWNVVRNPLPMSIALGIAWSAVGVPIPLPLDKGIDLLGAAAAPCALFAIGLFLSDKSLRGGLAEAGLATVVKLLVQPALAVLLVPLFVDAASVGGKVLIVMAALPTAANAFVLAKQFEISVEQNTATVLLTTALSVVTVSVVLVWLGIG